MYSLWSWHSQAQKGQVYGTGTKVVSSTLVSWEVTCAGDHLDLCWGSPTLCGEKGLGSGELKAPFYSPSFPFAFFPRSLGKSYFHAPHPKNTCLAPSQAFPSPRYYSPHSLLKPQALGLELPTCGLNSF